jgi:tetratricopeptide (TPR) repeat protein
MKIRAFILLVFSIYLFIFNLRGFADQPVLIDSDGDGTENNYLARIIAQDIVKQAWLAAHPTDPLPALTVKANVDAFSNPYSVKIAVTGWSSQSSLQIDLHPSFAWDAGEYGKLATMALGAAKAKDDDAHATACMADLLSPTSAGLASEDVRLSGLLEHNELDASAHEEAALILLTLALREDADRYADIRSLLCRATAHLALADALESGPPSWNNRIADTALRVLAGRELEAESLLDRMEKDATCPEAAKTWIQALGIWNKQDVSGVEITTNSPLLLKIAWFQTLVRNGPQIAALDKLKNVVGDPTDGVDWTRGFSAMNHQPVQIGNQFNQIALQNEYRDLNDILAVGQKPALDQTNLAAFFSEPETETVTTKPGQPGATIQVVGLGTFKAAARRHLFETIKETNWWLQSYLCDYAGAKKFRDEVNEQYKGVPFFELVQWTFGSNDAPGTKPADALRNENNSWQINAVSAWGAVKGFDKDGAASSLLRSYYMDGPPIGTTFLADQVQDVIMFLKVPPNWHRNDSDASKPGDPRSLFLEKLAAMHPHSADLAYAVVDTEPKSPADAVMSHIEPFLSYNNYMASYLDRYNGNRFTLSQDQLESMWKERVKLDSDASWAYGNFLFKAGRVEEAMAVYRQALANSHDAVLMSNSVGNLIRYDYDHGKQSEAMDLAKQAASVGSGDGLSIYAEMLGKTDDLDGQESLGEDVMERYGKVDILADLYQAHPDKFPGKLDALTKEVFPNGMTKVTFASFQGKPQQGVRIWGNSPLLTAAGLHSNDIIVALNGVGIENNPQYVVMVRELVDPAMDLIVWQGNAYIEVKASPPGHKFGILTSSYSSLSP